MTIRFKYAFDSLGMLHVFPDTLSRTVYMVHSDGMRDVRGVEAMSWLKRWARVNYGWSGRRANATLVHRYALSHPSFVHAPMDTVEAAASQG